MKVEKISDSALEIILTQDDLDTRNINVKELLEGDTKAQQIIYALMEEAERDWKLSIPNNGIFKMNILEHANSEVSIIISTFDTSNEQVNLYKQLYQQLEENLPLYYEMLDQYSADQVEEKLKSKNLPAVKPAKPVSLIYSFENIEDIKTVLDGIDVLFKNEILYKYNGKYYLVLYFKNSLGKKKIESVFNEFGTLVNNGNLELLLQEHGETIIRHNAMAIISQYY